jgi:acyl-CoA thioesterase-1
MRYTFCWLWLWCLALPLQAATVMVFGDSLSAAYGLPIKRGYVALLQSELGPKHRVVNASVSGETTNGGLSRLPAALKKHQPQIVVLELGANDGLRGLPLTTMRDNLAQMIEITRQQGAKPVLVAVPLPPNYGPQYTAKFHGVYEELAQRYRLPYAPSLLDGFEKDRSAFQADGLHPTAEAQPLMRDVVLKALSPLLH